MTCGTRRLGIRAWTVLLGLTAVLSGCAVYEPYPAQPYYATPYYTTPYYAPYYGPRYYAPCCASRFDFSYRGGGHGHPYGGHRGWH